MWPSIGRRTAERGRHVAFDACRGGGSSRGPRPPRRPPRSTTHSRHLHYIAATSSRVAAVRTTTTTRTGGGGEQLRPLRPPRLPTPSIPRSCYRRARAHYHHRQIQTLAPRGGGGKGEQPRPISLPGCPSRSAVRRATVASLIAATLLSSPSEEEGNGEAGAAEASCLPGRPSALHHSTPPSTRSRRVRHITTTVGARRGKEEQLRPLGLQGCPRDAATATPPSRCTAADRLPGTATDPLRRVHTTSTAGFGHVAPCAAAEGRRVHRPSSTSSSTAAKRPPGTAATPSPPRVLPEAARSDFLEPLTGPIQCPSAATREDAAWTASHAPGRC
jgi:hypothetical protein